MTGWFSRPGSASAYNAGYTLGIGLGFFAGCWVLGVQPRWRPREDLERLLVVVLPAVIGNRAAHRAGTNTRLARLAVAPGSLGRDSPYLAARNQLYHRPHRAGDKRMVAGPHLARFRGHGCRDGQQSGLYFRVVPRRVSRSSLSVCLAITSAGAALTVMLSGYATGGQIGFPLAAALIGTTALALFQRQTTPGIGPLGVSLVGLFSLLLIGCFFGALSLGHAVVLLCAPLLSWLPELSHPRRLPPWTRDWHAWPWSVPLSLLLLFVPRQEFNHDFQSPQSQHPHNPCPMHSIPYRQETG